MCLAILQKQNASKLDDKIILNSFENNDDGMGISYVSDNQLKIVKIMNIDDSVDTYNQIHKNHSKTSHLMIHFRIGTHGSNGKYNVHPFRINDDVVFCHNGIISNVPNDRKKSDTRVFNDTILKNLPKRFIHNSSILKMMSDFIGHSKLIFLNSDNQFKIVNQQLGHWVGKTWFSNSSYKKNTFDYGGYKSMNDFNQCSIWNDDDIQYQKTSIVSKQTRYVNNKCDSCNEYVSKQHFVSDVNSWVCGVCYNSLNKGI